MSDDRVASPAASALQLGCGERARLVSLARSAVERAARSQPLPDCSGETGTLARPGAAFVTLHACRQLRGCIGCIEPRRWSLAETVVRMAVAASQDDPRFGRVREEELPKITVEVSVLGPLVPVGRVEEIVTGRDGVVVEDGGHRGLLLPQVATEWGWGRETLLTQACRKAGLASDAWRQGARVYRFEAIVFGEDETGNQ